MNLRALKYLCSLLTIFLIIPVWVSAADSSEQKAEPESKWSYHGKTGPAYWGDLAPENITCKVGKNQSPININKSSIVKLKPIKFDYSMLIPGDMVNTGRGIQLNITSGGSVKIDKKDFALQRVDFHSPSEHLVDGVRYPLEAQFVHESDDKEVAVVSLLYRPELGPVPGNQALSSLIRSLPMNVGDAKRPGVRDIADFETRKEVKEYFRYNGSLTKPPCSEGVRWIVLKKLPTISRRQMDMFQKALKQPNFRPPQPFNARVILR